MRIPIISTKFARIMLAAVGMSFTIQYTSLAQQTVTESSQVGLALPDLIQNATDTLSVTSAPPGSTISRVEVQFNISHQFPADLRIELGSTNGGFVRLDTIVSPPPGPNISGGPPQDYTRVVMGLNHFNGEPANQQYTMTINDEASFDSGIWDNWSITTTYKLPGQTAFLVAPPIGNVPPDDLTPNRIDLTGMNIDLDATVIIDGPAGLVNPMIISRTSSLIVMMPRFGNNPGVYTIVLSYPGGGSDTGTFELIVPPPVISTVSPASVDASGEEQTVTIAGADFSASPAVGLFDPSGAPVPIPGHVISASNSSITFTHTFSQGDEGKWGVRVTTDGGTATSAFNVVGETVPTLDIEKVAGDVVKLSWPSSSKWVLNRTYNPTTGNWTPVEGAPQIEGSKLTMYFQIGNPASGACLFRLEAP